MHRLYSNRNIFYSLTFRKKLASKKDAYGVYPGPGKFRAISTTRL